MHGYSAPSERMEIARAMKAGGASWNRIVAATGISMYLLKCEMLPGYREKEQQKVRDLRSGVRKNERPKRMVVSSQLAAIGHRVHDAQIIPDCVLAERQEAAAKPLTISQLLFGDPLPGRSALDKMREESEMRRVFG